jgi:uncharacterized integral membrane protein (TIGR00698 family)
LSSKHISLDQGSAGPVAAAAVLRTDRSLPARIGIAAAAAAPGLCLALAVAVTAFLFTPLLPQATPLPAIVIALIMGIALHQIAARPVFQPGLSFAVKHLLRWAVALLGLRVAVGEIVELGLDTAALVICAMALTIAAGFALARCFRQQAGYGALAGTATAVCGASAALATAAVLPNYPGKDRDTVFVVVAVNALSTIAMLVYPAICAWLGFDAQTTGIMLGATIHDVPQVAGAGYAVGEIAGNTAVIVKLFRVFLLLPVVLCIGFWWSGRRRGAGAPAVPVPDFAFVFLALCILHSAVSALPHPIPAYVQARAWLIDASTWGLLVAIAALGLGTSLSAFTLLGWRQIATVVGTTLVILATVAGGLVLLR